MFAYTDPVARNFLGNTAAEAHYREILSGHYDTHARRNNSAFTWLEAFGEIASGQTPDTLSVTWQSFPLTAQATDKQIDTNRLANQDEYVEWRAEQAAGKLKQVTFTTEFPEYFEAFAAAGEDALREAIQDVIPGSNPSREELFGTNFNPAAASPMARAQAFRVRLPLNPWNNGQKGILCLTQQFNTRNALFNLLSACGIPQAQGTPQDTCGLVGGACGVGRSSDPAVCAAAQSAVRAAIGFTLRDPGGVRMVEMKGVWKVNNTVININDPTNNQGAWTVTRNGRRAVLKVVAGLKMDTKPLVTGAQISRNLTVASDLLAIQNSALPDWARIGEESDSRGPQ